MAKRKKSKKRVAGRPKAPVQAQSSVPVAPAPGVATELAQPIPAVETTSAPAKVADPRWAYVRRDVTKVGILASVCVLIELALWYIFNHTGLGDAVYRLIKI